MRLTYFSFTGVPKSGAQSLWHILGLPAQTRGRVVLGLQGEGMEIWGISVFIIPRSHSPYFCGFWSFQCLTFDSFQESTGSHVYPFPTFSSWRHLGRTVLFFVNLQIILPPWKQWNLCPFLTLLVFLRVFFERSKGCKCLSLSSWNCKTVSLGLDLANTK